MTSPCSLAQPVQIGCVHPTDAIFRALRRRQAARLLLDRLLLDEAAIQTGRGGPAPSIPLVAVPTG